MTPDELPIEPEVLELVAIQLVVMVKGTAEAWKYMDERDQADYIEEAEKVCQAFLNGARFRQQRTEDTETEDGIVIKGDIRLVGPWMRPGIVAV